MIRNKSIVDIIRYPILSRFNEILHLTSTRSGGVSSGSYGSLNLGRFSGDDIGNIHQNFNRFLSGINLSEDQLHLPFQTHGDSVLKIDADFITQNEVVKSEKLHGVDALITNLPNQFIGVSTADCVPVLLFDPVKKAVGAAHAGWRGTCSGIAAKTVNAMQEEFNTDPGDLIAVIGASISPDAYEVGDELITHFENKSFDIDKVFFRKAEKLHLDLWEANKIVLLEAGLLSENIEISGYCTFTEHERFFSARRLGIKSGRLVSGLMLK